MEAEGVKIKIEVTPVLRGCVYDPEMRSVSPTVEARFGFAEIQVVSFADLYAGKLVAALVLTVAAAGLWYSDRWLSHRERRGIARRA